MRRYLGAIYRADPVSFEIGAPVEIAIERLARVTSPTALLSMFQEALVGRVTESGVVLRYHRPWFSSVFAPVFMGRFTGSRNRTSLAGRFTLPWFAKAVLTVWLALMCLALLINVVSFPNLQGALPERLASLFMPLLMLVVGVFVANIGWWIGQRDVEFISRRVREALNSGDTEPPNEPDGKRSAVGIG